MRRGGWLIVGGFVAIGLYSGFSFFRRNFTVELPIYPSVTKTVWLAQNWTPEQRNWFHHVDQGTQTFGVPLDWFLALEQPEPSLGAPGLLSDPACLDRYGFIPDPAEAGDTKLPIGFASGGEMLTSNGAPWTNPGTGKPMARIGLTCAACHTGRFTYRGTEVLVDGAPALTNLGLFQKGLGLSLFYTRWWPLRFGRFADRVLGPGHTASAEAALLKQLDKTIADGKVILRLDNNVASRSVNEGFARLDALNRIGNTVFALDLNNEHNYAATSAPVHFPRIWNDSWFLWVQYNGSIEQPMIRNAGEALGVRAFAQLTGANPYASSVQVKSIFDMEQLLAGSQPNAKDGFSGLTSPSWRSDVLPSIDTVDARAMAAKGEGLYKELCAKCHMAPVSSPDFWSSPRWLAANAAGERYLDLELVDIEHIGTDPAQAEDMKARTVELPKALNIDANQFGPALGKVVKNVVNRWYETQQPPVPQDQRERMDGNRPNGIRAPLKYKVRPLNGIWATPPYLHNGSVPSLYMLLSPVSERPSKFYLGSREYDPDAVGYSTDPMVGAFEVDTSVRGNSNSGHEFSNDTNRKGVIGRFLEPEERRALIAYLKTL